MRIFTSVDEMYNEVKRDLKEMGITYTSQTVQDEAVNKITLELMGYTYKLDATYLQVKDYAVFMGVDSAWIENEASDRWFVYSNPNPAMVDSPLTRFAREDGRYDYTYPERLAPQLATIRHLLERNPNTRQAILEVYNSHCDLKSIGGYARVPCSMHYQILVRDRKVHILYSQRSCDFGTFFLADVAFAVHMKECIAEYLHLDMGYLHHNIGSLHVFEDEVEGVF